MVLIDEGIKVSRAHWKATMNPQMFVKPWLANPDIKYLFYSYEISSETLLHYWINIKC